MPPFDWGQLAGPLGGVLALALMTGMSLGWGFRVKEDKNNKDYLNKMLQITEKKLIESDNLCKERVDQVREDMSGMEKRHTLEITSIRAAHKDEVDTLRQILENVMKRLDQLHV